uniref:Uncharacterized protein n=1 Tax=Arundo donax TaxID=35708 RepID=A0A0A9CLX5_ARUDO
MYCFIQGMIWSESIVGLRYFPDCAITKRRGTSLSLSPKY